MKMMKAAVALGMALTMTVTGASAVFAEGETLSVATDFEVKTLVPWAASEENAFMVLNQAEEGLFRMDENNQPQPALCDTYEVTDDKLTTLASGVKIDTGVTLPCTVAVLAEEENRTVLEFTIAEGKNRQIRKMCEAVKLQIVRLKRNAVGNIKLGMLKPGEWADLTAEELKGLKALVSSDKSTKRTGKK